MPDRRTIQLVNLIVGRTIFWLAQPVFALRSKKPRTRVFLFARQERMILLVRNYIGNGNWDLPGGGALHGEKYIDAACREVYEETGISINRDSLEYIDAITYRTRWYYAPLSLQLYSHEMDHTIQAKPQGLELEAAQWFSVDSLPVCSEIVYHAVGRKFNA